MKSTEKYAKMAREKGYSLRRFANLTGVSDPYWSLLLKRGAPPSVTLGAAVAKVLPIDKQIVEAEIARDRILWLLKTDKEMVKIKNNDLVARLKKALEEIDFENMIQGGGERVTKDILSDVTEKFIDKLMSRDYRFLSPNTDGGCLLFPTGLTFIPIDPLREQGIYSGCCGA